jgi:hypothetical protein
MNILELADLRTKIIEAFSKHWDLNDEAHRYNHFAEVERCGHHINEVLGLKVDPKLIMLGAFFHDLFSWTRINHHELACTYIQTCDHPIITALSDSDRHMLSLACKHHRASYKGKFTYTLDELINSADRMFPVTDITPIVKRSLLYSMTKTNDLHEVAKLTFDHMADKYGSKGYARFPDMYLKVFEKELAEQRRKMDELTQDEVHVILLNMLKHKDPVKVIDVGNYKSSDDLLQHVLISAGNQYDAVAATLTNSFRLCDEPERIEYPSMIMYLAGTSSSSCLANSQEELIEVLLRKVQSDDSIVASHRTDLSQSLIHHPKTSINFGVLNAANRDLAIYIDKHKVGELVPNRCFRYDVAKSKTDIEPRYYVDANHCDCHPETCCCDDFAVYKRAEGDSPKEKVATSNSLHKAKGLSLLLTLSPKYKK